MKRLSIRLFLVTLIAAAVAAGLLGIRSNAKLDRLRSRRAARDIRVLEVSLMVYQEKHGRFPTIEQGLQAVLVPGADLRDDWGKPFIYRCPGDKHPESYDLFSSGTDRKPDTADDIWGDWKEDR